MGAPEKPTCTGTLGDRIRAWRKQRALDVTELAALAGLDAGYLSKVERSQIERPGRDSVEALARALGISGAQLDGYPPSWPQSSPHPNRPLRVRGQITAGRPLTLFKRSEMEALPLGDQLAESSYVLQVAGRSLRDVQIMEGDYLVVEEVADPKPGALVVVVTLHRDGPGRALLARYYKLPDAVELHPENDELIAAYGRRIPLTQWRQSWRLVGRVVGLYRVYGHKRMSRGRPAGEAGASEPGRVDGQP